MVAHRDMLRYRPRSAMTLELIEEVKKHKPELLVTLAAGPESQGQAQQETHADREIRRFLAVCQPYPDGFGCFDPQKFDTIKALSVVPLPQAQKENTTTDECRR